MAGASKKPVIFLAFANDRDDTVGYLRNLPDEARRLREVLESAEQAGLCEVVVRSNSTAGDIFKVFQNPKFRNRIAIFHYSGHANGYQLLLESPEGKAAAADAGGLAAFLAQQQGLQLVFLNGCSTQEQTQELHDANVSVVISTSRAIDDRVATEFADLFYRALAGGANLLTAYNEASAAIKTTKGGDLRALYFGDADRPEDHRNKKGFPWNLYPREGSESADQWNLPEAVHDPLFGLPPLPEQDLPETPYRHLNWFTRKDAEIFFGRGHQIRELCDRLTAPRTAPIILFYGQSGVGKSSILDAGLIPRLEHAHEVRYLRRTAGGLLDTLQLAFLPEASEVPIETAWRAKEAQVNKPLIVFLDQLEELYTRPIAGLPDELDQLLRVVKATFSDPNCRPQGKLVLGFRKEWLAELESHLVGYELPRTKVFLEPLDRRGIIEVVRGPARSTRLRERYGLTVEDGLAEIIADDLLEDRGSAIAPTLQILLTKMWSKATEENYEHPHFSQELYHQLKRDGILLRDFLNQQIAAFRERYPEAVDSGLLLDIVALHTTPLGTSDQCTVDQLQQEYAHLSTTLPALLLKCQDLHLLTIASSTQKESSKTTRLAHDTLAPLVRERFDESDKPGQRARRILDNRSVDWKDNHEGTLLDEADLKVIDSGLVGTRDLTSAERRMLEASRRARAKEKRVQDRVRATVVAITLLTVLVIVLELTFKGKGSAEGTDLLTNLFRERQIEPPESRDQEKIDKLNQELNSRAAEDTEGISRYIDLAQIASGLKNAERLSENDKLLAEVLLSLEDPTIDKDERMRTARNAFERFEGNAHREVAHFAIARNARDIGRGPIMLQFGMVIAVLAIWLGWIPWRQIRMDRRQRRKEMTREGKIRGKPNPFRRVLADIIDIFAALFVGFLVAYFCMWTAAVADVIVSGEYRGTASLITFVAIFTIVFSAYMLFRDAIGYTYRRSIGKILLQIRPVVFPKVGVVTMWISATRNGIVALIFVMIVFVSVVFAIHLTVTDFPFFNRLSGMLDVFELGGFGLMVIWFVEEFTMSCIGDGRTLLDRLSGTMVIDVRSEQNRQFPA